MSATLAYYKVLYDYKHPSKSNNNKYLDIRTGDVIEVDVAVNENLSSKLWLSNIFCVQLVV